MCIKKMILWSVLDKPLFLTYVLILCTALAIIIFEYKKHARLFKKGAMKRIPGPIQIPVLGNIHQLAIPSRKNRLQKYLKFYWRLVHLEVVRFSIYDQLFVFVGVPKYLEMILGNVKSAKKPDVYKILVESPLGGGLISQSNVNIWKAHRKIITPTFHFNVLMTYIPVFHEETLILINKLQDKLTNFEKCSNKITVPDILPYMQLSAFDMILRSAFGVNIQAQKNESHRFVNAMSEATKIIQHRIVKPWLIFAPVFSLFGYKRRQEQLKKICYEFTESVIRIKRLEYHRKQQVLTVRGPSCCSQNEKEFTYCTSDFESINESIRIALDSSLGYTNNDKTVLVRDDIINNNVDHKQDTNNLNHGASSVSHKSFLELIIENEANEVEKMSDEEIRDNMITIMFAGQDTTATTNCITLLMLSLHPEIQRQVLEEIDSIFGGPDLDNNHVPTHSEIMELHTLDRVIKETLRLYPAAPIFGRVLTSDVSMGPFILPEGVNIIILAIALHRDPNLHPRADEFWPDRFLPHNSDLIQHFSYIPFSAGSRNCVGQKYAMLQMKVVLSTILRKYQVSTDESITSLEHVDELVDLNLTLIMDRCPIVLTPRCNKNN